MQIKAYTSFRQTYQKLPAHIKEKVHKQLRHLSRDIRHPSLQAKKIKGTRDIWEARIDLQYRLSFEIIDKTIFLRVVGNHDAVLKHP